jgi:hypothetical protein
MSGANQNALPYAQDPDFRDGKRFIAVSRELELIEAGAPSQTAVYLEEELDNLLKSVNNTRPTLSQK